MKKLIALQITLILLLACLLSACEGNEDSTATLDEMSISDNSSMTAESSDTNEALEKNPLDITGTLWEGVSDDKSLVLQTVKVYDSKAIYEFQQLRKLKVILPFIVKSKENGTAIVEFMNGEKTTQEIKYTNVVYGQDNSVLEFTIKDEILGDIKFTNKSGNFVWTDMEHGIEKNRATVTVYEKDETMPYVAEADWILNGHIEIDCQYDYFIDYKCDIIYPNGKTTQKTVVIDKTENLIPTINTKRHYFQGTKPSFAGGEVAAGTDENIFSFYGIGDKYGSGYANFNVSVNSFGNGVIELWDDGKWVSVEYTEPVFEEKDLDKQYSEGIIDINGVPCEIFHYEEKLDGEFVKSYEHYTVYYNPDNSNKPLLIMTLVASEDDKARVLKIETYFKWTSDGDTVTITYPTGLTVTETVYLNKHGKYLLYEPQ